VAFFDGRDFKFVYKNDDGQLITSPSAITNLKLASVDDLFKSKDLKVEKIYYIAKEGVYTYEKYYDTWYKMK
jgi:hypothetical protein